MFELYSYRPRILRAHTPKTESIEPAKWRERSAEEEEEGGGGGGRSKLAAGTAGTPAMLCWGNSCSASSDHHVAPTRSGTKFGQN